MPETPTQPGQSNNGTQDYWLLCCECGYITHADGWLGLNDNPAFGEQPFEPRLILAPSDPSVCRCPACAHDHRDDDSGNGFYDGTREQVIAERARWVSEYRAWT